MFTRALFKTPDMVRQHDILCEIAELIDDGKLRATATEIEGVLCAANLRRAYETVETGKVIGKIVLRGYA
jgi:hypothetical protein